LLRITAITLQYHFSNACHNQIVVHIFTYSLDGKHLFQPTVVPLYAEKLCVIASKALFLQLFGSVNMAAAPVPRSRDFVRGKKRQKTD